MSVVLAPLGHCTTIRLAPPPSHTLRLVLMLCSCTPRAYRVLYHIQSSAMYIGLYNIEEPECPEMRNVAMSWIREGEAPADPSSRTR